MLCILTMTHTMMMFNGTHCRAIEINSEKNEKNEHLERIAEYNRAIHLCTMENEMNIW